MLEKDIPKTAVVCHSGTYEFPRVPFGVAGDLAVTDEPPAR